MSKAAQTLAEQFIPRYLGEFDNRYARANLPIDPQFIQEVEIASAAVASLVGAGFLGKMGSDIYDRVKARLFKEISQKYTKSTPRVITIIGEDRNRVILDFGRVRPFFKISKGWKLVLSNVTLLYNGVLGEAIEEEVSPSFFAINVTFRKGRLPPKAPYKIHTPILVGPGASGDSFPAGRPSTTPSGTAKGATE